MLAISEKIQLQQLAEFLAHLIDHEKTSNPESPKLIIDTLEVLIPDASQFLSSLDQIPQEQQWQQIITFVEQNILDEPLSFPEKVTTHEIIQIYHLLIQLAEQVTHNQQMQTQSQQDGQRQSHQNQRYNESQNPYQKAQYEHQDQQRDSSDEQYSNPTPSQLSSEKIHLQPLPKNQSELDYIQKLKENHKTKKQHSSNSHQITKDKNMNQQSHIKKQPKISPNQSSQVKITSAKPQKKEQKKQLKELKQVTNKLKPKTAESKSKRDKITQRNIQKSKQKEFILSESMNQQYDEPFESIAIQAVKQGLQNRKKSSKNGLKTNVIMRDNATKQIMEKAMRAYKYELKNKIKEEKAISKKPKVTKSVSKENQIKFLNQKQKQMESEIISQQLKYYYQLREKKLNYINHMHQLVQKLQKERYLNLHQQQKQQSRKQKQKLRQRIKQADHLFQENMKTIKQNYKKHKVTQNIQTQAQIQIMKQVKKDIKSKKSNEVNMMKLLWQEEERKLDLIKKDEEKIKQKLQDMYRRNKV